MSDYLIEQYRILHKDGNYANQPYPAGDKNVFDLFRRRLLKLPPPKRALDYGCGRCTSMAGLLWDGVEQVLYDPAIPEYAKKPEGKFDLVFCTDVMEHIPEGEVDSTLREIHGYGGISLFSIHLGPAAKVLPDGQNAHCTVRPEGWWYKRLVKEWTIFGVKNLFTWAHKSAFMCSVCSSKPNDGQE